MNEHNYEEIDFNPQEFMKIKSKKPLPKITKIILITLFCITAFFIWNWYDNFKPKNLMVLDDFFLNIDRDEVMRLSKLLKPSSTNENEIKVFKFKYNDKDYKIKLNISSKLYLHFRDTRNLMDAKVWEKMVEEEKRKLFPSRYLYKPDWYYLLLLNNDLDINIIDNIISKINNLEDNLTDKQKVELATLFVQNIKYDLKVAHEVTFFPYETLYLQKGVCDDSSILLAKILSRMGYDVALIEMRSITHMAVGVKCRQPNLNLNGYCYIETTLPLSIGELPGPIGQANIIPVGSGKKIYN